MGLIKAFSGALGGTFADQWKEIISAGNFDEQTLVAPGILISTNNSRGSNESGSIGVLSNGSKIYVPENTAAFIFSQGGIENVIVEPGGYEYTEGQDSVFNGDGIGSSIVEQAKDRFGYGGITSDYKQVAFINLREIRNIKFGTKGPQVYNDHFYGADLEVVAHGNFTLKIVDPVIFVRNYLPANTTSYSFSVPQAREQVVAEFLQSFVVALNSLSSTYRISQLPAHATELSKTVANDANNVGSWKDRFGFEIVNVAVENIEFTPESRELVRDFSSKKMSVKAYDDVSQKSANIAAQQMIAEGVQQNGLGDGGGMLFGMNIAQNLGADGSMAPKQSMSIDEQIETVKKLKELLDAGILSQEEFDAKKSEVMGL